MADILEEIVAWKRIELQKQKELLPERDIHRQVEALLDSPVPSLKHALSESKTGIIAEFKRKSPSKGWIHEDAKVEDVAADYERNGASAISILTDDKYFGGCDSFVVKARKTGVALPILYKNFVIDEYQLFRARLCGASATLLIAAALTKEEYRDLNRTAHALGLDTLLEMHSEREIEYADCAPDVCGINNRNLGTFVTDVRNSFRLATLLPEEAVKVSESGISDADTIKELRKVGYSGFLIGETFMKTPNPGQSLNNLITKLS